MNWRGVRATVECQWQTDCPLLVDAERQTEYWCIDVADPLDVIHWHPAGRPSVLHTYHIITPDVEAYLKVWFMLVKQLEHVCVPVWHVAVQPVHSQNHSQPAHQSVLWKFTNKLLNKLIKHGHVMWHARGHSHICLCSRQLKQLLQQVDLLVKHKHVCGWP